MQIDSYTVSNMKWLNLFTTLSLFLFYSLNHVTTEEYFIKANSTNLCTPPCMTLTQFFTNFSHSFKPNVTLILNPGRHYINISAIVSNLTQFSMTSRHLTAQIACTSSYSQIIISHSLNIHITNLEFIGCGGNQLLNVNNFIVRETTFKGQENSGTALELIESTAQIINCTFLSNRQGAVIATHSSVNISQSNFENNGAHNRSVPVYRGTVLFADQQSSISINASTFISNRAQYGVVYSYRCSILMDTNNFTENNISSDGVLLSSYSSTMTIEQSKLEDNIGTALSSDDSIINVQMCEFSNNTASYGEELALYSSNVTIEQSSFENNIGDTVFCFNSTVKIKTSNFSRVGMISYSSYIAIEHSAFVDNIINNTDPNTLNSVFTSQDSMSQYGAADSVTILEL